MLKRSGEAFLKCEWEEVRGWELRGCRAWEGTTDARRRANMVRN